VVVVAATGNRSHDLAHPTQDALSPDNTNPVLRQIHNDCAIVPVEVPGVIGVNANGNLKLKSNYSNYGVGTTSVMRDVLLRTGHVDGLRGSGGPDRRARA